jgi:hypothetical protein
VRSRPAPQEIRRLVSRLNGARVTYGKPIRAGDRTIIPVARVRMVGGFGFGTSDPNADPSRPSEGGGGGGAFDARPIGFIESGPEGTRYEGLPQGGAATGRVLTAGAAGAATGAALVGAAVGGIAVRRLVRGVVRAGLRRLPGGGARSPRRLIGR